MKRNFFILIAVALVTVLSIVIFERRRSHPTNLTVLKFGTAYLTNITSDCSIIVEPPRDDVYGSMILFITNSSDQPHSITIGTNMFWTSNGMLSEISIVHYGKQKVDFRRIDFQEQSTPH